MQLSRREQYLGKPASSVFSTPALSRIVSATENTDEIIAYKNTHLSVKTKNMMMHGLRAGTVVSLLNAAQIQTTEDQLRKKLHYKGHKAKYTFGDIITRSPRMIACIQEAKAFAQTDSNIVVVGETGTGKELLSQSIHAWSRRSQNNFVAINCAALPENLLESELFGYVEGAFTGATRGGKPGLFEIAHNGTIFLDEVGELPLEMQVKLLRVLQEKSVTPLGASKPIPLDVRIIASTNRPISEVVASGQMREDILYRINTISIQIPPLRRRLDDIPLLAAAFVEKYSAEMGKQVAGVAPEVTAFLMNRSWRGNVRELEHVIESAMNVVEDGQTVELEHLPIYLSEVDELEEDTPEHSPREAVSLNEALAAYEKKLILAAMKASNWKIVDAAARLRIPRTSLQYKLEKYDIKRR